MRLHHFVSLSAFILCGWLAVTFVTEVPVKRYPKLEKHVMEGGPPEPDLPLASAGGQSDAVRFSVSQ